MSRARNKERVVRGQSLTTTLIIMSNFPQTYLWIHEKYTSTIFKLASSGRISLENTSNIIIFPLNVILGSVAQCICLATRQSVKIKNCHKTDPFCLILFIFYTDFLFPIGFFPFVPLLALTLCFSRLCYSRILVFKPGAIVGVGDHERGVHAVPSKYRIYPINRPERLLNFWTLRVGAYSNWALIRGWALIKFSQFQKA